jgi:putative nucleotidyltransferase with HDIG domain
MQTNLTHPAGVLKHAQRNPTSKAWALQKLPLFPAVAAKLVSTVSREDCSFREVANLIGADAGFTADVLRIANSPLLACRHEVRSVLHAISVLGLKRVETLAMTVALRNFASSVANSEIFKDCWRHSLACAFAAEELAVACSKNKDDAYTAALMHDIGRIALLTAFPEVYSQTVVRARENNLDLMELEREQFDFDHCQVGVKLMREWKFPPEMSEIAGNHHQTPDPGRFGILEIVHAACIMADMLGFQVAGTPREWNPVEIVDMLPPSAHSAFTEACSDFGIKILEKINMLECSLMF